MTSRTRTVTEPAAQPAAEAQREQATPAQHESLAHNAAAGAEPAETAARLNQTTDGQLARAGDSLLQLQQQHGNRYVQQVIAQAGQAGAQAAGAPPVIQTKLALGPGGDSYEQEADRVAAALGSGGNVHAGGPGVTLRRQPSADDGAVDPAVEAGIEQARGGGQPLPGELRASMERSFGTDFGGVRVHADDQADTLNQALQARAFTTGQDIFFRQGEYRPASAEGQGLLAHELTHVVQQGGAPSPEGGMAMGADQGGAPVQRQDAVIQRARGNAAKLIEEHWVTVNSGDKIKYSPLAAGCLAVTVFYNGGGGAGVHLAMQPTNANQWTDFVNAIHGNAIDEVHLDADLFEDVQGWRVKFDLIMLTPETNFSPRSTLDLVDGMTLEEIKNAGWVNDAKSLEEWFEAKLGGTVKMHKNQSPEYDVP